MFVALVISGGMGLTCIVLGIIQASRAYRMEFEGSGEWISTSQIVTLTDKPLTVWTDSPGRRRSLQTVKAKMISGSEIIIVTSSGTKVAKGWLNNSSEKFLELPKNFTEGHAVFVYSKNPLRDIVIQSIGLFALAILSFFVLVLFFRNAKVN